MLLLYFNGKLVLLKYNNKLDFIVHYKAPITCLFVVTKLASKGLRIAKMKRTRKIMYWDFFYEK